MKVFLLIYLLLTVFIAYRIFLVDFFFGVFCLFFVVYSIFPLFGYSYLPELSAVIGMYFGESVFFDAILFSAGSFISIYVFFKLIYCPLAERIYFRAHKSIRLTGPGILLMALHLLSNAYFLISYGDILTYQNASDEKFISAQGIEYALLFHIFKFSVFALIVYYATLRFGVLKQKGERYIVGILFAVHIFLFVSLSSKLGNRTDPLAFTIGLTALEMLFLAYRAKISALSGSNVLRVLRVRHVIAIAFVLTGMVIALTILGSSRNADPRYEELDVSPIAFQIIMNDYYAPYHVMIAAIYYDLIEPSKVLVSNLANSLVTLNVPYLQYYIVDYFAPGTVTRSASPAMFIFAEGYVFGGWFGMIYNGIVIAVGLSLWRIMGSTTDSKFNVVALSLCIAMAANVARAQTSYFVKDIYLWFIPALWLYLLFSGLSIRLKTNSRSSTQLFPKMTASSLYGARS